MKILQSYRSVLFTVCFGSVAFASPATFVTALPVATDQLLVRFNVQPIFSTMGSYGVQFPVNIGYGFTSRWALFVNTNQGFGAASSATPQGPRELSSAGLGDLAAYARFTLFKIDKPKSTFRIAPLAGATDAAKPRLLASLPQNAAGSPVFDRSGALVAIVAPAAAEAKPVAGVIPLAPHPVVAASDIERFLAGADIALAKATEAGASAAGRIAAEKGALVVPIVCD